MAEKLIDRPPTLGLYCEDPARLAGKLMVSSLYTIDLNTARERGYRPLGAILPTAPRPPTQGELQRFVNNDAPRMLQALELPATFGIQSLAVPTQEMRGPKMPLWDARLPIIPGIDGVFMERRVDLPGILTTSIDHRFYNELLRQPAFTGMHFDAWPNTEVTYLIANIGSPPVHPLQLEPGGSRWHLASPWINRADVGDYGGRTLTLETYRYVNSCIHHGEITPDDPLVWWIRQDGPHLNAQGELVVDGLVGAHVANNLHDGSVYGETLGSMVVMASVEPIPVGTFPSLW